MGKSKTEPVTIYSMSAGGYLVRRNDNYEGRGTGDQFACSTLQEAMAYLQMIFTEQQDEARVA